VVLADLVCDRRVRKIPRRMSVRRYAVRRRRTPRRTPSPTPYITWNASATVILLLDVDESTSEGHHHWTPSTPTPYAVTPYADAVRLTPYAPPYAVAGTVYNLEHQRDGHSAAGRRREHIRGASSLDALTPYAVTPYADADAVRRRRRRI